jgi:hypothetical protein
MTLAKDMRIDALNAMVVFNPIVVKKNTAELSRTPKSPNDIGKIIAFTKSTEATHTKASFNET